ncbi:hypothetical protein CTAYLR_004241 [Chrysophaeum taylorii]|uniref:Shikimate dehydrogenase substrate binding N-terminal domain-containing protein n=1 Tax=Chrysophaeum taylorii TaxID=2483200 RepID=A0AAD7XK50_9STRA|nr:hypothetical protein CTAYLR_004241 [Chrysophaeum taylorii]
MSTSSDRVLVPIGPQTRYILSTSGRPASVRRYRALLEALGLDLAYIVINSDKPKIDAKDFVAAIRGLRALGGAISKDIKNLVVAELDEVDALALKIGAVNTVARRGDRLVGFNTDALGFAEAVRNGIKGLQVDSAVVYGYGGVTNVVAAVLGDLGISVRVTGRRRAAAKETADRLGVALFDPQTHRPDLFVNAAPVTDAPLDQASNFLQAIQSCTVVFDHELDGSYLKAYCRDHNLKHIPGTAMYWPQMHAQWSIFLEGLLPDDGDLAAMLRAAENVASSSAS